MIKQIFPSSGYKEEYGSVLEKRKQLKEKSKARKDAEDFSLIFEEKCKEIKNEG